MAGQWKKLAHLKGWEAGEEYVTYSFNKQASVGGIFAGKMEITDDGNGNVTKTAVKFSTSEGGMGTGFTKVNTNKTNH